MNLANHQTPITAGLPIANVHGISTRGRTVTTAARLIANHETLNREHLPFKRAHHPSNGAPSLFRRRPFVRACAPDGAVHCEPYGQHSERRSSDLTQR